MASFRITSKKPKPKATEGYIFFPFFLIFFFSERGKLLNFFFFKPASPHELSQEAEGAACGLHHPLLPARPLRSRPWDRRASSQWMGEHSPAPGEGAQRSRRSQSNSGADSRYLSVRPRIGWSSGSAWWPGAGAPGTQPSPSPPGSTIRSCPEGGHFPPSLSPCWPSAPRAGSGAGAAHRPPQPPTPCPGFSSRPLSPATFRALFSGWK